MDLKSELVRLAHEVPETRKHILPLLRKEAATGDLIGLFHKAFFQWMKKVGKATQANHVGEIYRKGMTVEIAFPNLPSPSQSSTPGEDHVIAYFTPDFQRNQVQWWVFVYVEEKGIEDEETSTHSMSMTSFASMSPRDILKMVNAQALKFIR